MPPGGRAAHPVLWKSPPHRCAASAVRRVLGYPGAAFRATRRTRACPGAQELRICQRAWRLDQRFEIPLGRGSQARQVKVDPRSSRILQQERTKLRQASCFHGCRGWCSEQGERVRAACGGEHRREAGEPGAAAGEEGLRPAVAAEPRTELPTSRTSEGPLLPRSSRPPCRPPCRHRHRRVTGTPHSRTPRGQQRVERGLG